MTKRATPKRVTPKKATNRWVFPTVLIGILLVGVVAVVAVAAGGSSSDKSSGPNGQKVKFEISPDVTVTGTPLPAYTGAANDPAVGMTAPTVETVDFAGKPVTIGGATGSPYALTFLAHWCPHCQNEVPRLVSVGKNGQIAGVDVMGVATGTTDQAPNYPPSSWFAREDWKFGVALDNNGTAAARAYGLTGYPYFVFVDASGKVVGRTSGEIAVDDVREIFKALAAGKALPLPNAGASSAR